MSLDINLNTWTDPARRALELAEAEARASGLEIVTAHHLLLGLLRATDTPGGKLPTILARLGVTIDPAALRAVAAED